MKKQLTSHKRLLLIIAALVAVGLLSIGIYTFVGQDADNTNGASRDPITGEAINLDAPTDQEKQETESNKQRLAEEGQADPAPSGDEKQKATPRIGYISQSGNRDVEANGYIAEAIEADGTCTLTLEKDGVKIAQSKQAMPDAQSTVCGQLVIERSRLSAGRWRAMISYSSSKYQGVSEERTIEVV